MKRSIFLAFKEKLSNFSKKPWGCFETTGPTADGKIEFSISCNKAFLDNLKNSGFQGITDEETVQNFFLFARMAPEGLLNENSVNPESHPNLTNEANRFIG